MSRTLIRQKIITDCAALFNEKGYQNIAVPEIEKATGQTKAVLYGYFENKQKLAQAVLEYNLAHKRELILQEIAAQPNYISKLTMHIELHQPEKNFFISGGCPILNAGTESDYANEEFRQIADQALSTWKQDVSDLIAAGIQAGEFRVKLAIGDLAWMLISMVEGAVFISHTTQNAKLGRQLLQQAKLNFFSYLMIG